MADYERAVLEHYQLPTAFPTEWPAEKDESDASDDEELIPKKKSTDAVRPSRPRYSALERATSDRRSLVPGSQKTGEGLENLVQKDEPDPLGTGDSVVRILRGHGLPVQDNIHLRKFYGIQSTPLVLTFRLKETDTYFHQLHSRRLCFYPKCTIRHQRNNYFGVSRSCPAQLTRNQHL